MVCISGFLRVLPEPTYIFMEINVENNKTKPGNFENQTKPVNSELQNVCKKTQCGIYLFMYMTYEQTYTQSTSRCVGLALIKLYIDKVGQESCTKTWLNGTVSYFALGSGTVPPKMEWLMNAGDKLSKVGQRDITVKFNTVLPLAGGMVGTYVRTCVCDVRTGT